MRLAGHCIRHPEEMANNRLVLLQPTDGRSGRGRRKATYIDNLLYATGMDIVKVLRTIVNDRVEWKKRIKRCWTS